MGGVKETGMEEFSRTEMLIGKAGVEKLQRAHVAVFGVGGVGGYVIEALARSGVGQLTIVDNDTVSESNINRQIIALHSTVGKRKTEVMAQRLKDINQNIRVTTRELFFLPETPFDFTPYDYVVDAIDTVSGKIAIVERAKAAGVPVISAMGAGNKLDPTAFAVADIQKTSVCPLARVMRRELKKRGVKGVKVVYSKEEPRAPIVSEKTQSGKPVPASIAFAPSVMGLLIASEVIKDLLIKGSDPTLG